MPSLINYTNCPSCNSQHIALELSAKDYTVSKELFEIWHCKTCTLRFTQQVPDATAIVPYYQSSAYISHTDTKDGLINKLYHLVRNFTLKSKRNLIKKQTNLSKGNLLDIGAGTGAFAYTMQQANWQVTGLEPDTSAIKIAADKFAIQLQNPQELYQLQPNTFDAITMWHVLEHVHDLHGYLEKFASILKPTGKLFIAVPNYTSYDAAYYKQHWAAYDVPRHLYHFSPTAIDKLAQAKGFKVEAYKPMWFDSFYVSMLSEQYKNDKQNLLMAYIIGCISNVKTMLNVKKCSSIIYVLSKQ